MPDLLALERALWEQGLFAVAGVDEAGRGALFGPVVAAAVILDRSKDLSIYRDSKTVPEARREDLFDRLQVDGHAWAVGVVGAVEIDRTNILRATLAAMAEAVEGLTVPPKWVLVDGLQWPELSCRGQTVVHGDARSASIAAASIVAKVYRDRMVRRLAENFPGYGLLRNKGYGTREHIEALRMLGPTPEHRRTFRRVTIGGD